LYRRCGASTTGPKETQSAPQPLNRLFRSEPGKQLLSGQSRQRMAPVGGDFGEWYEHESTLVEPRVRQHKRSGIDHLPLIIEEIEIEHTRCVSFAAHPAKLSLDHLQHREQ